MKMMIVDEFGIERERENARYSTFAAYNRAYEKCIADLKYAESIMGFSERPTEDDVLNWFENVWNDCYPFWSDEEKKSL